MPYDDRITPVVIDRVRLIRNSDTVSDQPKRRQKEQPKKEEPRKDVVDLSAASDPVDDGHDVNIHHEPEPPESEQPTHIDFIIK